MMMMLIVMTTNDNGDDDCEDSFDGNIDAMFFIMMVMIILFMTNLQRQGKPVESPWSTVTPGSWVVRRR